MNTWWDFQWTFLSSIKEILFQLRMSLDPSLWLSAQFLSDGAPFDILVFMVRYGVKHVLVTQWVCFNFVMFFKDSLVNAGFNCGEAANFGTPQWLAVAKEAAVRRAAMNYLPMLSHQQLLYLLTMSFVSRSAYQLQLHMWITPLYIPSRRWELGVSFAFLDWNLVGFILICLLLIRILWTTFCPAVQICFTMLRHSI